jgi:hypothetical protein
MECFNRIHDEIEGVRRAGYQLGGFVVLAMQVCQANGNSARDVEASAGLPQKYRLQYHQL